jgi:hypothetical protein
VKIRAHAQAKKNASPLLGGRRVFFGSEGAIGEQYAVKDPTISVGRLMSA